MTVNRIWQHHFGTGLVATSDNLGFSGAPPTHPELLDYLAASFRERGWSAKALHRLILTSAVYRQSERSPRPGLDAIDPNNRLLARFPLRRLDAEAIRDAMLAVSGELDGRRAAPRSPRSGPTPARSSPQEPAGAGLRRSVYLQQRRTQVVSLLEVFDAPSIVTTCTRRLPATIPLQSLSLLNSDFVVARARKLAERPERECGGGCAEDRIARVFLLAVGRAPDDPEREAARRFLETQPARYAGVDTAEANAGPGPTSARWSWRATPSFTSNDRRRP